MLTNHNTVSESKESHYLSLKTMSTRKPNTTNRFVDFEDMWEEKDHENEKVKKTEEKKKKYPHPVVE